MMGFFRSLGAAREQQERVLELKSSLLASVEWKLVSQTHHFGSGIRVGFATVDCRRCGKTESGLLLDQSVWEWQTHKMSYANCHRFGLHKWAAEYQGPQAAKTKASWIQGEWSSFDESTGEAWVMEGLSQVHKFEGQFHLEGWIIGDFMAKARTLKQRLAERINASDELQLKQQLKKYMELENPDHWR